MLNPAQNFHLCLHLRSHSQVRASAIAGKGLFATASIPSGTVLGAYPGRLRSGAEMLAKCEYAPMASSYAFRTGEHVPVWGTGGTAMRGAGGRAVGGDCKYQPKLNQTRPGRVGRCLRSGPRARAGGQPVAAR